MARSHKPIVWGPFAGGGTFAAFFTPILIFVTGIAIPLGLMSPEALSYGRALAFAQSWIGKLALFAFVALPAWHAAHRARITVHDFGVRADIPVAVVVYSLAALATATAGYILLKI